MTPEWQKKIHLLLKATSLVTVMAGGMIVYDLVLPSALSDTAEVTGITSSTDRNGTKQYYVHARGRYTYNENIERELAEALQPGDILDIQLTHFMKEFKSVAVKRGGQVRMEARGKDLLPMGIFGFLFLLAVFAWSSAPWLFSRLWLWTGLIFLNGIGILVGGKYLLVLAGVFGKM